MSMANIPVPSQNMSGIHKGLPKSLRKSKIRHVDKAVDYPGKSVLTGKPDS